MKRLLGALLIVLALGSMETAAAFNGQRQGFLLGFGLGASSLKYEAGGSNTSLVSDLKLGYGFSDQFLLFYTNKVNWRSAGGDVDGLALHGMSGIGANYYFTPNAPSFFLGGGVGLASRYLIRTDSDGDINSHSGTGFYLGGGFEFARHWNLELSVIRDTTDGLSAWTYMVTINALAY